jgi:hypothetical protein
VAREGEKGLGERAEGNALWPLAHVRGGDLVSSFIFMIASSATHVLESWTHEYWLGRRACDVDPLMLDRLCRAGVSTKLAESISSDRHCVKQLNRHGVVDFLQSMSLIVDDTVKALSPDNFNADVREAFEIWIDELGRAPESDEALSWFLSYAAERCTQRFTISDMKNQTIRQFVNNFFRENTCRSYKIRDARSVLIIPSENSGQAASRMRQHLGPASKRWYHGCTAIAAFTRLLFNPPDLSQMIKDHCDLGRRAFYLSESLDEALD